MPLDDSCRPLIPSCAGVLLPSSVGINGLKMLKENEYALASLCRGKNLPSPVSACLTQLERALFIQRLFALKILIRRRKVPDVRRKQNDVGVQEGAAACIRHVLNLNFTGDVYPDDDNLLRHTKTHGPAAPSAVSRCLV